MKRWEVRMEAAGGKPVTRWFFTHRAAQAYAEGNRDAIAWAIEPIAHVSVRVIKHTLPAYWRGAIAIWFIAAYVGLAILAEALPTWLQWTIAAVSVWPLAMLAVWVERGRWDWRWWRVP